MDRLYMEKREQKRESAKKSKNFSIYSQKAVRAKEALINKWQSSSRDSSFAASPSTLPPR